MMNQNARGHGSTDWHLPSPSSTPTSATYTRFPYETPKSAAPQSQFYDVFRTPISREGAFETPMGNQSGEKDVPHEYSSFVGASSLSLNNCLSNFQMPIPSYAFNPQPSDFAAANAANSTTPIHPPGLPDIPGSTAADLANIQTPPPTRDSNNHKASVSTGNSTFCTPSTVPNGQPLLSNTVFPSQQSEAPVFSYSGMQFSPDTAPVLSSQFAAMPIDAQANSSGRPAFDDDASTIYQANFGINNFTHSFDQNSFSWQTSNAPTLDSFISTEVPLEGLFVHNSLDQLSQQNNDCKPAESERTDEASSVPTTIINPALVFNGAASSYISPSKNTAQSRGDSIDHNSNQKTGLEVNRQLEESFPNRKAEALIDDKSRESYLDFANSFKGTGLRRSNTDSAVKRRSLAFDSRLATTLSREPNRRASPLKANGNGALGSIPEIARPHSRASVVLTVDEHGNARTETRLTSDRSVDSQHRQKYSDLWNGTESDSDPEMHTASQSSLQTSSARPKRDSSKSRSADSHAETLGLLTSSTSNMGSSSTSRVRQRLNRTASDASRRYSIPCLNNYSREASNKYVTEGSASAEKASSAQAALKQKKESRKRRSDHDHADISAPNSKRWSMPSSGPLVSSSSFSSLNNLTANLNLASASAARKNERADTATFASPVTEEPSDFSKSSPTQQCIVCSSADARNGYMVRCDSCFKWLHAQCATALEREDGRNGHNKRFQNLAQYTCFFCSGQASSNDSSWATSNRGRRASTRGTINDHQRNGNDHNNFGSNRARIVNKDQGIAFLSPLTHQSFYG